MKKKKKKNPTWNFEDLFKQQLHTANLTLALEERFSASKHLKLDFLAAVDNKPRRTNETCLICGEWNVYLHKLLSFFKEDLYRGNRKSQVVVVVVTDSQDILILGLTLFLEKVIIGHYFLHDVLNLIRIMREWSTRDNTMIACMRDSFVV